MTNEPSFDDWAELMQDPPGGLNHGRKRAGGASWYLDVETARAYEDDLALTDLEPAKRRSEKPAETIPHGTLTAYVQSKCRCAECRRRWADYIRARRNSSRP